MKTLLPLVALLLPPVLAAAQEPPPAEALRGDVAAKKRALAHLWGRPADENLFPLLREAMKDADRGVRQMAAGALAWSGAADKAVIDELIQGMAQPGKPGYRVLPDDPIAAREALAKAGAKAVPALVAALEDKKYPARPLAVWALGEIGRPAKTALPAIEAAVRDRDPGVGPLHHLVEAKYQIDGDAAFATKHLVPLLDTEDGRGCGGANRVIAGMGADAKDALPALVAAMKKYKEREICHDLAALAPHFREAVVRALREALADPELARSAASALWDIGEAEAEVEVAELIKNPEKYRGKSVRVEVVLERFRARENWAYVVRESGHVVIVSGRGEPRARDGDRVAITGKFVYLEDGFVRHTITDARIEKRGAKKP